MKRSLILVLLFSVFLIMACKPEEKSEGVWDIKVVDSHTGNELDNVSFVITDIDKVFIITKDDFSINIPRKSLQKNKKLYPYGYTTITSAEGYLPRIDHNFKIGGDGDGAILLELEPIQPMENRSFTEVFHNSSEVELVEFLNNYE